MTSERKSAAREMKSRAAPAEWDLWLYVAGQTPRSLAAIFNVRKICNDHLKGQYRIRIIDVLEHPQLSRDDQIVAIPTLVRKRPGPMRKIIGDFSDTARTLAGLELRPLPDILDGLYHSPPRQ